MEEAAHKTAPDEPPRLTLADLARALAAGEGCLDIRPPADFEAAHLPGAASIPWSEIPGRRHELPPRPRRFCVAGEDPRQSLTAMEWLRARGWTGARALDEPLSAWPGPWESGEPTAVLWEPSALVRRWAPRFPAGPVLDLGCGAGRDAVHVARLGHRVVAVDRLPDALAMAAALARRHRVEIECVEADLRRGPPEGSARGAAPPPGFAAVLMIRFYAAPLSGWIAERLMPGGYLLIEGLAPEEVARGRMRRLSRTCDPAAARAAFPGWQTVECVTERGDEPLCLTRLVLRKEHADDPDHDR